MFSNKKSCSIYYVFIRVFLSLSLPQHKRFIIPFIPPEIEFVNNPQAFKQNIVVKQRSREENISFIQMYN